MTLRVVPFPNFFGGGGPQCSGEMAKGVSSQTGTPETHHPVKGLECFGPEASAYTDRVLAGRRVELELDVEHRDKYGRLLAYIYLDGRRFNDRLLELGYARVLVIPPNGIYARPMLQEQLAAKRTGRGSWAAC